MIIYIPSIVLNTDALLDSLSNLVSFISFLIIGIMALVAFVKGFDKKNEDLNKQKVWVKILYFFTALVLIACTVYLLFVNEIIGIATGGITTNGLFYSGGYD